MANEQNPPAQDITPEMFREMIEGRSDEEILTSVKGNEEALLDGIFDGLKNAFDPSKAAGQSAIVQYDLEAPGGLVSYQVNVDGGTCTVEKSTDGAARVTLGMSMPNFIRLMAGQLDGMTAFTSGQLKISGDMMFTQTMTSWFTPPSS